MPQHYGFKRLIDRYSVPFTLISSSDGRYDEIGEWVDGVTTETALQGALVPLPARAIYQSGGRLTQRDRQLYKTGDPIPEGSTVVYKGHRYKVESWTNHGDYADFDAYLLKSMSNFDEVTP